MTEYRRQYRELSDETKQKISNSSRNRPKSEQHKQHISHKQYQCKTLRNGNLIIEKNVTTRKLMKRITIYDKGKEMKRSANLKFAQDYGIEDEFNGLCRIEMNLNTKEQIRSALGICDTRLRDVLTASANPILEYMKEVISPPEHQ